nr:DUF4253 domain-containing protein [Streptomyces avicenniae]
MITSDEGEGDVQPLWLSDEPPAMNLWGRIRAAHADTGLWPLLLLPLDRDDDFRPWATGELFPENVSSPGDHDAAALLTEWWGNHISTEEDSAPATAPFGRDWPGLAQTSPGTEAPDVLAAEYALAFASFQPEARLGLVAAPRGADALAAVGWDGPVNYAGDTGKYAAVLRSWEERFGVRVVAVGFATLYLSVAAPPTTRDEALAVAAEHFAFCPDNIWQGPGDLATYAERLVDGDSWQFWWD